MASKVEASRKPPSRWHIKLSTTLIRKGLEIENGILEGYGIQCFTISHSTKLCDGHTMWSWFQCQLIITLSTLFSIDFDSIAQCQYQEQCHLQGGKRSKGKPLISVHFLQVQIFKREKRENKGNKQN